MRRCHRSAAACEVRSGPGLFNVEVSYYDSRDDSDGTDPFILNSQFRFLTGYEWEAARNFTVGLQYYLEHVVDYDELIANSPFPQFEPPENRHVYSRPASPIAPCRRN